MRFGAACSNVQDPWFRGCSTIPRVHVFSSASQPCRNYPTRTERDILASYAEAIITATGSDYSRPLRLLELGAGTAAKTGILLKAATRLRNEVIYFLVDVSSDALDAACDIFGCLLPYVQLQPMVENYITHPPKLERFKGTEICIICSSPGVGRLLPRLPC